MRDAILIISTTVDLATDAVVLELERKGHPYLRLNTDQYPYNAKATLDINAESYELTVRGKEIAPRSIWYRRTRSPQRPEQIEQGIHQYCLGEAQTMMRGCGHTHGRRVMSPPEAIFRAENKIVQLQVARSLGLPIPSSCITNDPARARSFVESCARAICKPLRSGWFQDSDGDWSIYTTQVTPDMMLRLDSVALAPAIFQELLPKSCDVRVTVVGDQMFCAEIDSQSDESSRIDWRRTSNPDIHHSPCVLPNALEVKLRRFMRALSLEFGAIDLVRTPEGNYFFLEVNPNGQWLWLDQRLDLGITNAVASWLAATA